MSKINANPEMTDTFQNEGSTDVSVQKNNSKKIIGIVTAATLLGSTALAWGLSKDDTTPSDNVSKPSVPPSDSTKITIPIDTVATLKHDQTTTLSTSTITPTKEITISHNVVDTMTYEQAFETAHKEVGSGGLFTWHNSVYNTYYKEEWQALSLSQRQTFLKDCGFKPSIAQNHKPGHPIHPPIAIIDPIYIETIVNGERVVGIDNDSDGLIDNIVIQGKDGFTYKLLDNSGNQGLDTLYIFDPITQETKLIESLEKPVFISNDDFQEYAFDNLFAEMMNQGASDEKAVAVSDSDNNEEEHDNENSHDEDTGIEDGDDYDNDGDIDDMN